MFGSSVAFHFVYRLKISLEKKNFGQFLTERLCVPYICAILGDNVYIFIDFLSRIGQQVVEQCRCMECFIGI